MLIMASMKTLLWEKTPRCFYREIIDWFFVSFIYLYPTQLKRTALSAVTATTESCE